MTAFGAAPGQLSLRTYTSALTPALVILVGTFCIYAPSLTAQFHPVDDWQYVTTNPYVLRPTWQSLGFFFSEVMRPSTVMGYYQPLAMASLMLDRTVQLAFSPADAVITPYAFHFTNVLIHALNSVLVFLLVRRLTNRHAAALLCGLVFAVHPINVECVTWISQRKAVLSTFFMLIALLAHIQFAETKRWLWYGVTIVVYAASVLSKPTGLLLPLALLMLDVWPLRRFNLRCIAAQIPNFIIAFISGWIAHHSQLTYFDFKEWNKYWSVYQSLLIACHGLAFYVSRTFLPLGLSPEYLIGNDADVSMTVPAFALGVAGSLALLAVFVRALWKRDFAVWTLMASYAFLVAPSLAPMKFQESIAADRFAYSPMVFLLALMAEVCGRCTDRRRENSHLPELSRAKTALASVIVVSCLLWPNLHQQRIRGDTRNYYASIAQGFPGLARGHFCMGRVLLIEDDGLNEKDEAFNAHHAEKLGQAEREFREVLRLEPQYVSAYYSLAEVYVRQSRPDEAIAAIKQGMSQPGAGWDGFWLLGTIYSNAGRYPEAIEAYREFLKFRPLSASARKNLAGALLHSGHSAEALEHFQKLHDIEPNDLDANQNWGVALITMGRFDDAIGILGAVVDRRRSEVEAHQEPAAQDKLADAEYTLAGALALKGDVVGARALLASALRAKPELEKDFLRNPAFAKIRTESRP